jgi:hypothetical protein
VFFEEFGEHLVFALQLVLEGGDLFVLGVVGGGLGAGGLEGGGTVLEEDLLPLVVFCLSRNWKIAPFGLA